MSCTKNQIGLWTVNGTLLAETTLLITGNFRLLCCAMSEVYVCACVCVCVYGGDVCA